MAFEERKACLWHAFNALGEQGKGVGVKSQLKVLTQNIGTSLDLPNTEAALDDYRSGTAITFHDYLYYLQVELFNRIQNSTVNRASLAKINFDRVDEICWMVCATRYAARKDKKLTDNDTYKLWRLFNFLAETDDSGELCYPVVLDREEAEFFAHKLLGIVSSSLDPVVLKCAIADARVLDFHEFLTLVESTVCRALDKDSVALAMGELHEEFIVQVIKKGYLLKKGHVITNWKERWFVLTPRVLRYFTSRDEKDRKGEIFITQYCKAEALPEKVSSKPNRFSLVTEGKTYEISAPDLRTRTEWISNLNSSAEHSSTSDTRQKRDCRRRAKLRRQQRALSKQEEEKRQKELDQMAKTRQELKSEKQARADAEARFQQEAALREAEQQRLREVEELRQQLQRLLEAERQAKKDEEIVRSLQSRILEEEFEKREKLEQLKTELEEMLEDEREKREGLEEEREHHESMLTEERHKREGLEEERKHQESMLTAEREKREDLEEMRRHHEVLLREEQHKLEQVEQERLNMDTKMEEALAKLHDAERVKEELREKMLKKEQENLFNIKVSKLVHPEPLKFASHRGLGAFAHIELRHVAGSVSSDASPSGSIDGDGAAGDVGPVVTDVNTSINNAGPDVKTSINNNEEEDEQSNDKESPLVTPSLPADS